MLTLKTLHRIMNAGIFLSVIALIVLIAWGNFGGSSEIDEGDNVSKNLDFRKDGQTLFVFLNSNCSFCISSKDFYLDLFSNGINNSTNTLPVAVFTEDDTGSSEFLSQISVREGEIQSRSIDFASVGVFVTPLLVLVDAKGVISKVWKGKLTPTNELSVFETLGSVSPNNFKRNWYISEEEFSLLIEKVDLQLLDIRDRDNFAKGHEKLARNIPFDELAVRAVNELDTNKKVVLISIGEKGSLDLAGQILINSGFEDVNLLYRQF